jgi:hypothetical protein
MRDNQFILNAYPGAVALKRIEDPMALELRSMALHLTDLQHCREAVVALNAMRAQAENSVVETLWMGIVTRYFKCFGKSAAGVSLIGAVVLDKHVGAMDVYMHFKRLRDQHVAPDVQAYSQSFTAVVLNDADAAAPIADIATATVVTRTSNDAHIASLARLIDVTHEWVTARQKQLRELLMKRYARYTRAQLLALPDPGERTLAHKPAVPA